MMPTVSSGSDCWRRSRPPRPRRRRSRRSPSTLAARRAGGRGGAGRAAGSRGGLAAGAGAAGLAASGAALAGQRPAAGRRTAGHLRRAGRRPHLGAAGLPVARETVFLSTEARLEVDAALAPHLEGWGDRRVEAEARKAAYRADPAGLVERRRRAEADRHVGIRPAPETMVRLTALLPVAQGVACYASLSRQADMHPNPDRLGRGQLMADLLIERLTGQHRHAAAVAGGDQPGDDRHQPARPIGRRGLRRTSPPGRLRPGPGLPGPRPRLPNPHGQQRRRARRWIRRLYTKPATGQLVAMESRRRVFTANQQRFLRLRDQTCRTPWCDAPIRHADHIHPWNHDGKTAIANGQGLCQACNHAKQAPGWQARPGPDGDDHHHHPHRAPLPKPRTPAAGIGTHLAARTPGAVPSGAGSRVRGDVCAMAHEHRFQARLEWAGSTAGGYAGYERSHQVTTPPVAGELALSAAPAFRGDAEQRNPEQLVLAAASSCQLLSFLACAARAGIEVLRLHRRRRGRHARDPRTDADHPDHPPADGSPWRRAPTTAPSGGPSSRATTSASSPTPCAARSSSSPRSRRSAADRGERKV